MKNQAVRHHVPTIDQDDMTAAVMYLSHALKKAIGGLEFYEQISPTDLETDAGNVAHGLLVDFGVIMEE